MKIIGPRAIVGHRRQTRIERLHSARAEGENVDASPSETINGGRRAAKASARVVFETRKQKAGLGAPAGTGAPLEIQPCGYGLRLAPKPRSARKSWLNANRHGSATCPRSSKRPRTSSSQWGTDDTHRRSRPRSRHPPRGKGRVEHRNERGPTFRFVVCRVLPGDIALRPCCDGRELGESSECVPSDEGVPRARNRNPISLCFVL